MLSKKDKGDNVAIKIDISKAFDTLLTIFDKCHESKVI